MSNELKKRLITSIIILTFLFFLVLQGGILFKIFVLLIFLLASFEWFNLSKNKFVFIMGLGLLFFSSTITFYIIKENLLFLLVVILICVSSDVGGFVFGKIFKGPKLTKISPNKTYSGLIGSYFFSVCSIFLFFKIIKYYQIFTEFNSSLNILIIMSLIISTTSQIGDLIISFFKRIRKVKNTGNLLPGHGGILDRIDGMIFSIPISYFIFL
jgi:phosphatidate cytidylyltransferase